jgi:hypothetical protein
MSPAVRKAPAQLYLAFVRVPRMPGQAHAYMGPGAGFAHAERGNKSPVYLATMSNLPIIVRLLRDGHNGRAGRSARLSRHQPHLA